MSCVSRSDVGAENVPLSYLEMLETAVDFAPAGGMKRPIDLPFTLQFSNVADINQNGSTSMRLIKSLLWCHRFGFALRFSDE